MATHSLLYKGKGERRKTVKEQTETKADFRWTSEELKTGDHKSRQTQSKHSNRTLFRVWLGLENGEREQKCQQTLVENPNQMLQQDENPFNLLS